MKFATKLIRQYSTHLRHVATLHWEIKNSNFRLRFDKVTESLQVGAFLRPVYI